MRQLYTCYTGAELKRMGLDEQNEQKSIWGCDLAATQPDYIERVSYYLTKCSFHVWNLCSVQRWTNRTACRLQRHTSRHSLDWIRKKKQRMSTDWPIWIGRPSSAGCMQCSNSSQYLWYPGTYVYGALGYEMDPCLAVPTRGAPKSRAVTIRYPWGPWSLLARAGAHWVGLSDAGRCTHSLRTHAKLQIQTSA